MNPASPGVAEEQRKQAAALQRAVSVTRMVDYGVPLGDALNVHALTAADGSRSWDAVCGAMAEGHGRRAADAQAASRLLTAAQAWRAASALLLCAQLAYNEDTPRKLALYEQASAALARHAALASDLAPLVLATPQGRLHGWIVHPAGPPVQAAVLLIGGLSGWGGAYLDMGRALAARGLLAILCEGPGQGLTRLREGMHLDATTLPSFSAFLDHAEGLGASRLGVWGNSFGGLFAAHVAALDSRVRAVCINGAPMRPSLPSFRTAREQLVSLFGVADEASIEARLRGLAMDPQRHRIDAALLVLEGGRDPLVPLGEQHSFFALAPGGRTATLTWEDGEHTIYNHADERNAQVADWFAEQLDAPDRS